jgi:hypothetical protein
MQILTTNNQNFEKPRNTSNRTKVKILRKIFLIANPKNLVLRMLSRREIVRASKFWQKIEGKESNFFF